MVGGDLRRRLALSRQQWSTKASADEAAGKLIQAFHKAEVTKAEVVVIPPVAASAGAQNSRA
jgi:hypothetical protein